MQVFELGDRLRELSEAKDELQRELKVLNVQLEEVNKQLVDEMVNEELQSFNRNDRIFYLKTTNHVSSIEERREVLYETLKQQGYGDLIKETIHAQTLKAFVNEQMEQEFGLPTWLEGLVAVFSKDSVVMRKS